MRREAEKRRDAECREDGERHASVSETTAQRRGVVVRGDDHRDAEMRDAEIQHNPPGLPSR